jgi:hypothetical protein
MMQSPNQTANDPDIIAEKINVSSGARSGGQRAYTDFATRIEAKNGVITIHATEPVIEGKGVDIRIGIPYGVLPDLLHRVLGSLGKDT